MDQGAVQNRVKDTGTITIVTREKEHTQVSLVKAYFNGKEASVLVDTGLTVSTIQYDDPTQNRIFKIGKMRTCTRTCNDNDDSTKSKEKS